MSEFESLGHERPPDNLVAVGDYAFTPPYVPTIQQVEEAELFVFSRSEFFGLEEEQRRRNVIRLAINSAMTELMINQDQEQITSFIPLIGDVTVVVTSTRHEGTILSQYEIQNPNQT